MKPAWPAEPTLSIPTLLAWTLRVTSSYIFKARIFSFADMLPLEVLMSVLYSIVIKSQVKKNQHKTTTKTICKTTFTVSICLKITRPDVRLLKYGE